MSDHWHDIEERDRLAAERETERRLMAAEALLRRALELVKTCAPYIATQHQLDSLAKDIEAHLENKP
jgi:hypothetical protein